MLLTQSSIHGLRFIFDPSHSKLIRLFWLLSILFSLAGMSYYARGIFYKLLSHPDVGHVELSKPIRELPFPAITICSPLIAKTDFVDYSKFLQIQEEGGSLQEGFSKEEQKRLSAMLQACGFKEKFINKTQIVEERKGIVRKLDEGSPSISDTFYSCRVRYEQTDNCSHVFNKILTDHGMCFAYNMQGHNTIFKENYLSPDFDFFHRNGIKNVSDKNLSITFDDRNEVVQWELENGYLDPATKVFPYRIKKGINDEIKIRLHMQKAQISNICEEMRNSYRVIFHMPNEIPTKYHPYIYLGLSASHMVTMSATLNAYDKDFSSFSPENRGCYFQGERELEFFKIYTKSHCVIECLSNYTVKTCGCAKFSMPREPGTPICGLKDAKCLRRSTRNWGERKSLSDTDLVYCDCLPSCYSIDYHIKLANYVDFKTRPNEEEEFEVETVMEVHFEDYYYVENWFFITYKLSNFFADIGGLLGLFMGCSVLSIVELFYFLIKSCLKIRRERLRVDKDEQENLRMRIQYRERVNYESFYNTLRTINEDSRNLPNFVYYP